MVLCKKEVQIPLKRGISHRFDTPHVKLQVEAGADDCCHKLIKMWVLDEEEPWSLLRLAYSGDFRDRGQPWGELQVIRVSTLLAKILMLSPITTLRYPLEAFVPQYQATQYGPMQKRSPYST